MTAIAARQSSIDRLAWVQLIRKAFARSPLFREAAVSQPLLGPEGEVMLAVSFDRGPAVFRIVAGSEDEAYALLHELAGAMVEIDQGQKTGAGRENQARAA